MGSRREADARAIASERERFERECATPKDNWEGNEKGYIQYLYDGFSYDRDKNGKLIKLRGKKAVKKELYDYLDNPDNCVYHQAIHRGYRDWMLKVREIFNKMVENGEFKRLKKSCKKIRT